MNDEKRHTRITPSLRESLHKSLEELDKAIEQTKATLISKGREDLVDRLEQYESISEKQRELYSDLEEALDSEKWEEVNRITTLIGELSRMLAEDAKTTLSEINK